MGRRPDRPGRPRPGACQTGAVRGDLTAQHVIESGGWSPNVARVLLIRRYDDEHAIVLVDGNGDGAEIELEQWYRGAGGWACGPSNGIGSVGVRSPATWVRTAERGCVVGFATPGASVTVAWHDDERQADADDNGVWVCTFTDLPPEVPDQRLTDVLSADGPYQSQLRHLTVGERRAREQQRPRVVGVSTP